jgi:uncharacterized protein (DUF302 family)
LFFNDEQEKTMSTKRMMTLTLAAVLLGGCGARGAHHGPGGHGGHGGHGGNQATATHGLIALKSPYAPAETMNRLEAEVKKRNLAVVSRIDHAAAAQRIGQTLRPTELLVFGNPQAGTPLMLCAQLTGIDLPMKALVWADAGRPDLAGLQRPAVADAPPWAAGLRAGRAGRQGAGRHRRRRGGEVIEVDDAAPSAASAPGRSCPLHYQYRPEDFAIDAPEHLRSLDVLYVVGGLYGNPLALDRVLEMFDRERGRKRLVFNGDFHWFDADPEVFAQVQRRVLAHEALRGNVETELADPNADADAGCGCAYPDWVGDGVVERSNRILARLRTASDAGQRAALAALPMWQRADVGPLRLGIVHGDATSLAGWGFAQEHLRDAVDHRAEVARWLDRAERRCLRVHPHLPAGVPGRAGVHQAGTRAGFSTTVPPACPTSVAMPRDC